MPHGVSSPALDLASSEGMRVAARLRPKYEELVALRRAHEAGCDPPDVRERLRRLAARFPGALRELDRVERPVLERRLDEIDRVLRGDPVPMWMWATDRTHRWLRIAMRIRARDRSGRRGRLVPRVESLVASELGLTAEALEALLRPPVSGDSEPT